MPVARGKDSSGPFYRYGTHGKKYYYTLNDKKSREDAFKRAKLQERAIHASGYREKL